MSNSYVPASLDPCGRSNEGLVEQVGGLLPNAEKIDALVAAAQAFLAGLQALADRIEAEGKVKITMGTTIEILLP